MSEHQLAIKYHKMELREAKALAKFYAERMNKYTKSLYAIEDRVNYHAEQLKRLEEQS